MKKFTYAVIIFSALILLVLNSSAQTSTIRLGLKVAPSLCWMNPNEQEYNYDGIRPGIAFGFVTEINLTEHYVISTGVNFSFMGGKLEFPYVKSSDTGIMNRTYGFRYLEVPLMIKMKTQEYGDFAFFGQIGIGTGFNLRTKASDELATANNELISGKSNLPYEEVSFIREAIIAGIGAEYKIDESVTLSGGLNYSNSLNNVLQGINLSNPSLKNRSSLNYVELSIGVLF